MQISKYSITRATVRWSALCSAVALGMTACGSRGEGTRAVGGTLPPPAGYSQLSLSVATGDAAIDVTPIALQRVRRISLGDSVTAPARVQDALVIGDSIYVLDSFTKTVRVFDRRGHSLFSFGHDGHGPDGFADPFAIGRSDTRLVVLNMRRATPVQFWDRTGHYRGTHAFTQPSSSTSFVVLGDTLAVSTFTPMKVDGQEFLTITSDSAGTTLGHGCLRDPRYAVSAARRGILPLFSPPTLTTDGRYIYCTQPASAVVQILDARGNLVGAIRRTPPFYRPPGDAPNSMNPKIIYGFLSTWTGFGKFFPRPSAFVSLFTTSDSSKDLYKIFACDSSSGPVKCVAGDSPGRLLSVLPGDTLMILENPERGSSIPTVGFYVGWK